MQQIEYKFCYSFDSSASLDFLWSESVVSASPYGDAMDNNNLDQTNKEVADELAVDVEVDVDVAAAALLASSITDVGIRKKGNKLCCSFVKLGVAVAAFVL